MTEEPPKPGRPRQPKVPSPAELKALYETGTSIRAIARAIGRSYTTVHYWLGLAGTEFRPRGASRAPKPEIFREQPGDTK